MKVIVIDDEPLARSIVVEYLQSHSHIEIVKECGDGFEGVKAIQEHKPDLVFLDVQMPKISGFEMLELLEQMPNVIFTTAFDEYAIKAFEAQAIDYLLKPFSKERFDKALQKYTQLQKSEIPQTQGDEYAKKQIAPKEEANRIVVKTGNNIRIVPTQDILYLEAYDDYVKIYTQEGFFLKKKTMNHYESVLDSQRFLRVHRSYIINIQQITRIEMLEKDSHIAILRTGSKVPLSKTGYPKLKEMLGI